MKRVIKRDKVFVAGAAGFIGQRVCRELAEKGYSVHGLIYSDIEWERVEKYTAKTVKGDLLLNSDVDSLQRYLRSENIPYVIFLVGSVNYKQDYQGSRRANVDTARAIKEMCAGLHKQKILKKLIFIGSVASRGFLTKEPSQNEWLDETSTLYQPGLSSYCDVKHEAEDMIRRSGLPAVIIEPGSLVGRTLKGTVTTNIGLIRHIIKGMPVLSGGASYTSADQMARGIVQAVEKGKPGESYLLGGENITMKDFAVLVRSILSAKHPSARQPLLPVTVIPEPVASFLGSANIMINKQQALLGSTFHYIDWDKANRELGYEHTRADLEREIEGILKDLLNNK